MTIATDSAKTRFNVGTITAEIANEVERAISLFPTPLSSVHEALGVIREEYCEYEETVFDFNLRKNRDTRPHMREELIHLAAMCVKAIMYTTDVDVESKRRGDVPKPVKPRNECTCPACMEPSLR
jgi:hypothetical protein